MLRFNCPHCGKAIKAGDEAAGKKGKCPACGEAIHLPQIAALSDDDVLAALGDGPGSPVEKSLTPPIAIAIADDWLTVRHKPRPPDAIPRVEQQETPTDDKQQIGKKLQQTGNSLMGLGCGLGCLLPILLICVMPFGSPRNSEPSESMAEIKAERFVRQQMRSPSTAHFVFGTITARKTSKNGFTVTGEVDGQNAFGATIRNKFICKLRYVSDDMWKSEGVTFIER